MKCAIGNLPRDNTNKEHNPSATPPLLSLLSPCAHWRLDSLIPSATLSPSSLWLSFTSLGYVTFVTVERISLL